MSRHKPGQLDLPLRFKQRQAVGRAHLALEGKLVSYTIKRSLRRRAISIQIDEDGVRVGAPWQATQGSIERLMTEHGKWILRKLDEWQGRSKRGRGWFNGESVMLLGETYTLKLVGHPSEIGIRGRELVVPACAQPEQSTAEKVHAWLQRQALRCFEQRVAHYRERLDIAVTPTVLLSSARTRWGSCHTSGRIHLNWRLIQMPARLLDYVVAHEVAHLIEMNHSQRFWRTVGRLIPDYSARRTELRREGHRYLVL
jgi:predicted metal-dependent hydrolase